MTAAACSGVAARPYDDRVPPMYTDDDPAPLVLLLHGYTMSGAEQEAYFAMGDATDRLGYLLAMPDGRKDKDGQRFWDAGPCCEFSRPPGEEDVAYLLAVLDDMASRYTVDAERVYVVGFSNGGFMAHRLACEHPDRFAGIASFAGTTWLDPAACGASAPMDVLQIHGTADEIVPYEGLPTPDAEGWTCASAEGVSDHWATVNGCGAPLTASSDRFDLDADVEGAETAALRRACDGPRSELWRMEGSPHVPPLRAPAWGDGILAWLAARER
jgi:polyhydroxybutyrate depolymerase